MVGVGTLSTGKPSRSEELGTPEEQEQHALEVQHYLATNAPRRPLKPARSDAADQPYGGAHDDDAQPSDPPEYHKYQELLSHSTPLETTGSGEVSDDYTESSYYQNMAAINKQHHTTGTGFIKVGDGPQGFHLLADAYQDLGLQKRHPCNPAMNDWYPGPDTAPPASQKPLRSESSLDL